MSLFKNGVGRPSNETIKKRRIVYVSVGILAFGIIFIGIYLLLNGFFGGNIEGNDKNAGVIAKANKFVVQTLDNNCYKIYAPTKASYWRVQLSYNNKVYKNINHYKDGKKFDTVCLKKQKATKEKHKISLKWTKGANDKKYGSVLSWKPSGWLANIFTGWGYKYYNVEKESDAINKNGQLTVKEPESSTSYKERTVDFKISQTYMNTAYYSIIQEKDIDGSRGEDIVHTACKPIKKGQEVILKHYVKKYELGSRYKVTVFSDSKCSKELAKDWTYHYVYLTNLDGIATPTNKLSKGGAGLSIKLFQTEENLRYYHIKRQVHESWDVEVLTDCKPIKYGSLTEEVNMQNDDRNVEYMAAVYSDSACREQIGDNISLGKFTMGNNQVFSGGLTMEDDVDSSGSTEEKTVNITFSQNMMSKAYYSIVKNKEVVSGTNSIIFIDEPYVTCKLMKGNQKISIKHSIKKYNLGATYTIRVYNDSKCKNEITWDKSYYYVYKTNLNGVATPSNKLSNGGAGLSIQLFQTEENLRYYHIKKTIGNNKNEVLTDCKPIKYGSLTQEIKMKNGDKNVEYKVTVYSDSSCRQQIGEDVILGKFSMLNNKVEKVG